MSAYRESAATPRDVPERVCGGIVVRHVKPHKCTPPGFWSRLWHRLGGGDLWQCPTCLRWYLGYTSDFFYWKQMPEEWGP